MFSSFALRNIGNRPPETVSRAVEPGGDEISYANRSTPLQRYLPC
jgi:hypothetical protein